MDLECRICGARFESRATGRRAYYCSGRCRSAADRAQESGRGECAEDGCSRGVRAKGLCTTHYNRKFHAGSQRLWPADPEKRRAALRRKTQKRRAIRRGVDAEAVDRDVVGDRDRWRCGICRRKVDTTLAWPHPRSPSLDHIIPISENGPHTYANCRIAHLDCNMNRSNKGGGEQLLLFGEVA